MALITRQIVRTSQPQELVGVDWNNPLARGLIACVVPHLNKEVVSGKSGINVNGSTQVVSSVGRGTSTNGSSQYSYVVLDRTYSANSFTLLSVANYPSPQTSRRVFTLSNSAEANTLASIISASSTGTKARMWVRDASTASGSSVDGSQIAFGDNPSVVGLRRVADTQVVSSSVGGVIDPNTASMGGAGAVYNFNQVSWGSARFGSTVAEYWGGGNFLSLAWGRALSDAEIKSVSDNPYQLFEPINETIWIPDAVAAPGTSLTPGAGSVTVTGYTPTLGQTAHQALTPSVGSVGITGYAPAVSQSSALELTPGVGSVAITGYAPTLAQSAHVALVPSVGALSVTGYAPTITQDAGQIILPGAGTVAATGYAPTIGQTAHQAVLPGVGSVAVQGYAPTVTQASLNISVSPAQGAATYLGYAPLVQQTGGYVAGAMAGNRPAVSGTRAARLQTGTRAAR